MIYTVTANPSIDYYMGFDEIQLGTINRAKKIRLVPGGKGINVSLALKRLGVASCALGFVAGRTGSAICRMLQNCGCRQEFIHLAQGESRINIKLCAENETECNAPGPITPPDALEKLENYIQNELTAQDVLVVAGNAPQGAAMDYYARLTQLANRRGAQTVVDTSGEMLRYALEAQPWLVKPNAVELSCLAGHTLGSLKEIIDAALIAQKHGARNVLVSMGGMGALLISEDGKVLCGRPPVGTIQGTVGAGDSMVAGFLLGWQEGGDLEHMLCSAIAAGSAAVFSEWLVEESEYKRCLYNLPRLEYLMY